MQIAKGSGPPILLQIKGAFEENLMEFEVVLPLAIKFI